MGVGIISVKYQTQSRGNIDLDILQACIGEEIKVITNLYFNEIYFGDDTNDRVVTFAPDPQASGILFNKNIIRFSDYTFLNNCKVGDILYSNQGTLGNITILEIISGGIARVDVDFTALAGGLPSTPYYLNDPSQVVYITTPLKSLIYQFGINDIGGYVSKTDQSLQKFSADSSSALTDAVSLTVDPVGNKDWQIDSIELVGLGDDSNFPSNARVMIRVTHTTVVTPLFLTGQYDNMRLGIAPDYFKPDNAIKYQAQIDWNKSSSFLDLSRRITLDPAGQFGWYGTKYNGAKSDYKITNLTLQRVSDSEFVNQLEYNEIEVKFILTSTGANFSTTDTALIFGFNYLPENNYQDTDRLLSENFCFESKRINPDNISVNGDNFGTDSQIIKTIKGNVLTTTTAEITVRILFGDDRVSILEQEDVANYAMWIICERTDLDIEICDKSALLVQVDTIYVQLTKVDLLTDTTKFIEHPSDLVAAGLDTLAMFPVDDVAVNSVFGLDYTGLENDGIILKSCTPQIILKHETEADIILDSFKINLDNFTTVGSSPAVQAIDFNQFRPYKIENGIRKYIAFERAFDLDTDSTKYFVLNFPFMNRWEYWLRIAGITNLPTSLFDPTVQFNGANHLWDRLANISGWSLVYKISFQIIQNGKLFQQDFEHALTSTYFDSNTDWNNCNIKTYDLSTSDEIIVGSKKYAYSSKDTKVVCSFEKTVGAIPDIDHVAMVVWAEGFEGGGISEITRISSMYDVIDASLFKSTDTSNRLKVTKTDGVFTGEAILRGDKINNLSKMSLYARIYEIDDIPDYGRITNDFILRFTNDGQVRLVLS